MNEKLPMLSKEQLNEVGKELLPTEVLRESLDLTERGNPKPTISNVVRILKSDCNRISEMMHHFPEWEAVGTRTVSKYGRVRAWRRKADTSSDDGFIKVSEQMEIPFK